MKSARKELNLQPWNAGEEDSNTKSDDGGNKDIDIIDECWNMLSLRHRVANRLLMGML